MSGVTTSSFANEMTCGCTGMAAPTRASNASTHAGFGTKRVVAAGTAGGSGSLDVKLVDLAERVARDDDDAAVAHREALPVSLEVFADALAGRDLDAFVDDAAMQAGAAAD